METILILLGTLSIITGILLYKNAKLNEDNNNLELEKLELIYKYQKFEDDPALLDFLKIKIQSLQVEVNNNKKYKNNWKNKYLTLKKGLKI